VSREPSQQIGRYRLELPCIFIPDGYQGPQPRNAFGRDTAEFRCILIPDSYDGPRPGYPWIEFGRMTLDPAPVARSPARAARETVSAAVPAGKKPDATAGPTMAVSPPGPRSGEFGEHSSAPGTVGHRRMPPVGELGGYASPDITVAMALWNLLSDPREIRRHWLTTGTREAFALPLALPLLVRQGT